MSKVKEMNKSKSEVKKISEQELTDINQTQKDLQSYLINIGAMEVEKAKAIYQVSTLENKLNEIKASIEKEYGAININLADGSYEDIVVDEQKD